MRKIRDRVSPNPREAFLAGYSRPDYASLWTSLSTDEQDELMREFDACAGSSKERSTRREIDREAKRFANRKAWWCA